MCILFPSPICRWSSVMNILRPRGLHMQVNQRRCSGPHFFFLHYYFIHAFQIFVFFCINELCCLSLSIYFLFVARDFLLFIYPLYIVHISKFSTLVCFGSRYPSAHSNTAGRVVAFPSRRLSVLCTAKAESFTHKHALPSSLAARAQWQNCLPIHLLPLLLHIFSGQCFVKEGFR